MINLFKNAFKSSLILLITTLLLSCEKEEKTLSKNEFVNPIKIDSLISDENLLKREFNLKRFDAVFDFNSPIAQCEIKKYSTDFSSNVFELEGTYKIAYTKFNKINSISIDDYKESSTYKMIYDSIGRKIAQIDESYDKIYDTKDKDIDLYEYHNNGNLKSKLSLVVENDEYLLKEYSEFEYSVYDGGVLVTEKYISKYNNVVLKENKMIFDKEGRMKSYSVNVIQDKGMFASSSSETDYFYENKAFPNKPTKIELTYMASNNSNLVYFKYDKKGCLIEKREVDGLRNQICSYDYSNDYKELKLTFDYLPKVKSYMFLGQKVDNHEKHSIENFFYNENNNILKYIEDGIYEKQIEYKYDNKKNWIEKKIINREILSEEFKKINPKESNDFFVDRYIKNIDFVNFEKPYTIGIINLDKVSKIKQYIRKEFESNKR